MQLYLNPSRAMIDDIRLYLFRTSTQSRDLIVKGSAIFYILEAQLKDSNMFGQNMVTNAACDLAADIKGRKALTVVGSREICSGGVEEAARISLVGGKPAKLDTV